MAGEAETHPSPSASRNAVASDSVADVEDVGARGATDDAVGQERLPALVFTLACVLAVPFYLWAGRAQWFHQDEFAVLTDPARSPVDLFRPHNEHLIVPTRLLYAVLWPVFGLRNYVPYQVFAVVAHVALAAVMRVVLVRSGVSSWVAAAGALVFLTFGRGYEDIVWAFQITFTGALLAGYVHLLLALRDGPLGRRDVLGLLAGAVAVTSAGPGIVLVVAVGLATLIRRGPRVAAFHTLPLLVPLGVWFVVRDDGPGSSAPGAVVRFVWSGLQVTAERATLGTAASLVLVILTVIGIAAGARAEGVGSFIHRSAAPLALAVAGALNWLLIGYSRADALGIEFSERPRYSHVALALLLPLVVVGLDGAVRRWRVLFVPVLALLLAGVPANLGAVEVRRNGHVPPELLLAVANSPLLEGSAPDRSLFPDVTGYRHITAGWLLEAREAGKIPDDEVSAWAVSSAGDLLAVEVRPAPEAASRCHVVDEMQSVTLDRDDQITLAGTWIAWITVPGGEAVARPISSESPVSVTSTVDDLQIDAGPFETGSGERCD